MTDLGFGNLSNIARANQKVKEQADIEKVINKKDNPKTGTVKDREILAGTKQVESKLRKEELPKTIERYKSFKAAYQYQLGEQPYDDEEIEEEIKSKKITKKEEVKQEEITKPTLEQIEEYKEPRNKFKLKLQYFLGDDFNEEEPYQEENLTSYEKIEDAKEKIKLAQNAYSTLIEYISNYLGDFSFDNISDLKAFLENGMPEDAIIKFIILHQLSRSEIFFPSILDLSIILDKLNNLNIKISIEDLNKNIDTDFGTTKKLKYTVAGFIYVPLQEVMNLIIKNSKNRLKDYFNKILEKYSLGYIEEFNGKISEEIVTNIINLSKKHYSELINTFEKKQLFETRISNNKNINDNDKKELENLNKEFFTTLDKTNIYELDIAKLIYIFFYISTDKNILEYNNEIPFETIRNLLLYCRINIEEKLVKNTIKQKIKYNIFLEEEEKSTERRNIVQTDFFDNRIKAAIINIENKNTQKQTEFIKKSKLDDFDTQNIIFWYKQRYLKEFRNKLLEI